VVRDSSIKAELGNMLMDNPATKAVTNAPVVIVACAELGVSGYNQEKPDTEKKLATDKGEWYMFDVALAMENLVLAAQSLGLATVHVARFDAKKAASILQVPDGFCVVEMTPLGYPDQQRDPRPRKELSEIIFYDRFGVK
jgi:nitroreductase